MQIHSILGCFLYICIQMAIYEQQMFLFHTVHLLFFHSKENLMTEMANTHLLQGLAFMKGTALCASSTATLQVQGIPENTEGIGEVKHAILIWVIKNASHTQAVI